MNGIVALPDHVRSQVTSAALITSINDVVVELFKNSLDASGQLIDISIDYGRGDCSVEDNGLGICPQEFERDGNLAKPFCSSRDPGRGKTSHGQHGLFLSSLITLAKLSITSRHPRYLSCNELVWHYGNIVTRHTPASPCHDLSVKHGTRVRVRDLFGNLPVRVKGRAHEAGRPSAFHKEWRNLRLEIVALLLSWPFPVDVIVRNVVTQERLISRQAWKTRHTLDSHTFWDEERVRNILCLPDIMPLDERPAWTTIGASAADVSIVGLLSLEAAPTQNLQFLSIGIVPLPRAGDWGGLYDSINRLFADANWGEDKQSRSSYASYEIQESSENKLGEYLEPDRSKTSRKRPDRWPMFYFRISISQLKSTASKETKCMGAADASFVHTVNGVLRNAISEILKQGHLRLRTTPSAITQDSDVSSITSGRDRAVHGVFPKIHPDTDHLRSTSLTVQEEVERESMGIVTMAAKTRQLQSRVQSWISGDVLNHLSRIRGGEKRPSKWLSREASNSTLKAGHVEACVTKQVSTFDVLSGSSARSSALRSADIVNPSGKVMTRPFHDVYVLDQASPSKATLLRRAMNLTGDLRKKNGEDSFVPWYNGINKETIIINARTGNLMTGTGDDSASSKVCSAVHLSAKPSSAATSFDKRIPSFWIQSLLQTWENPTFPCAEDHVPHINVRGSHDAGSFDDRKHGLTEAHFLYSRVSSDFTKRISKAELYNAQVIAQIDRKFILIETKPTTTQRDGNPDSEYNKLILIDQHAADERCHVEQLMQDLFQEADIENNSSVTSTVLVNMVQLDKALNFSIPRSELQAILRYEKHFQHWGIQITGGTSAEDSSLSVSSSPRGIAQRCSSEPSLLLELIRAEVRALDEGGIPDTSTLPRFCKEVDLSGYKLSWFEKIQGCPQGIIDLLNSRACRSAIMFNDELSIEECRALVAQLSGCAFPFQCAHGRPSMVPLLNLCIYDSTSPLSQTSHEVAFSAALESWQAQSIEASTPRSAGSAQDGIAFWHNSYRSSQE